MKARHDYLLVAIEYFPKWVEAASYTEITVKHASSFLLNSIVCRCGMLDQLISNQCSYSRKIVATLIEKYKISYHTPSSYRPQANGAVEVTHKNVCRIIAKMDEKYKDCYNKPAFPL